jgi:selenocysteine lyase/cysteine desulfurase
VKLRRNRRKGVQSRFAPGAHCSHPHVWRPLVIHNDQILQLMQTPRPALPGMVRASFDIYHNDDEVDALIETAREIAV